MKGLKEKLETIRKLQSQKEKERQKLSVKYERVRERINSLLAEMFDFKGKFIRIHDDLYEYDKYMYCEGFTHGKGVSGEFSVTLYGYGFQYEFTEYKDGTWISWGQWTEHEIRLEGNGNVEKAVRGIYEISRKQFDDAFSIMMSKMLREHNEYDYERKDN